MKKLELGLLICFLLALVITACESGVSSTENGEPSPVAVRDTFYIDIGAAVPSMIYHCRGVNYHRDTVLTASDSALYARLDEDSTLCSLRDFDEAGYDYVGLESPSGKLFFPVPDGNNDAGLCSENSRLEFVRIYGDSISFKISYFQENCTVSYYPIYPDTNKTVVPGTDTLYRKVLDTLTLNYGEKAFLDSVPMYEPLPFSKEEILAAFDTLDLEACAFLSETVKVPFVLTALDLPEEFKFHNDYLRVYKMPQDYLPETLDSVPSEKNENDSLEILIKPVTNPSVSIFMIRPDTIGQCIVDKGFDIPINVVTSRFSFHSVTYPEKPDEYSYRLTALNVDESLDSIAWRIAYKDYDGTPDTLDVVTHFVRP